MLQARPGSRFPTYCRKGYVASTKSSLSPVFRRYFFMTWGKNGVPEGLHGIPTVTFPHNDLGRLACSLVVIFAFLVII